MKATRRLSAAHRAKISAGLRKHHAAKSVAIATQPIEKIAKVNWSDVLRGE